MNRPADTQPDSEVNKSDDGPQRLYLSVFDLALSNFPEGCFEKRCIRPEEARQHISRARAAGQFLAVSERDLVIDGRRTRGIGEVCAALAALEIKVSLEDFFTDTYCTPLEVVTIERDVALLVVSCHYELDGSTELKLAADSFTFHLFLAKK